MKSKSKIKFLKELTSRLRFKSISIKKSLSGSTPPSVFVGRINYPKVFAGPLISLEKESSLFDLPEKWIFLNNVEIASLRLQIVRGKKLVRIKNTSSRFVEQLQEIALAKKSVYTEAEFKNKLSPGFFHEDLTPYGSVAELKKINFGNFKLDPKLEKIYYDYDLKARDAITLLREKGVLVSQIQKVLSVGALGYRKQRKLVPTRWSITAVDSLLAKKYISEIKDYPKIDSFLVFESAAMKNSFYILMLPSTWQFEMIECFITSPSNLNNAHVFSDYELHFKKNYYSPLGGGYYAARFAVAEYLVKKNKQASVLVFREVYPEYIPLGVWNVRENVRNALKIPRAFNSLEEALSYINKKLLVLHRWFKRSKVIKNFKFQKTLKDFKFINKVN